MKFVLLNGSHTVILVKFPVDNANLHYLKQLMNPAGFSESCFKRSFGQECECLIYISCSRRTQNTFEDVRHELLKVFDKKIQIGANTYFVFAHEDKVNEFLKNNEKIKMF